MMPVIISCGVTVNAKVIWLNDAQFMVELCMPFSDRNASSAADEAADRAEDHRLDQHGDHHRKAAEAQRAQRRDLAHARRDRVVERVQRGEQRRDAHHDGQRHTDGVDDGRHQFLLIGVKRALGLHADAHARILGERILERLE